MKTSKRQISIGKIIILVTIVNILLMFGLAGFSIYNLAKFQDLTSTIVKRNYKILMSAKIIGKLIANMSKRDAIIQYSDRSALERDSTFQKIFNDNKEEVQMHLGKLGILVKTHRERESFEKIRSNFPGFCKNFYTRIKSFKSNESELLSNDNELLKHQIELVDIMQKAVKSIIKGNNETIGQKLKQLDEIESKARDAEYLVVLVTLVFFMGIGYFLYSRIKKPIEILKKGTQSIFQGKLGTQITIHSGDEFEGLSLAFNKMSKKVKELDDMKSEFIHVVTHELRTPLTSMKEANSLIKDESLGPISSKQAQFLDITEQGINRLIKFIDEILELSKMESSLYKVHKKGENIIELVSENLLLLQGLIEEKKIKVVKNFHDSLPEIELDSMMISRVVTNLLSNAIKHTPQNGELSVEIALGQGGDIDSKTMFGTLEDNGPVVGVYVRDSGRGIDSKNLDNVFSKFYQVKKTKNAKTNGSGLGLAISKEIILAHKGLIGARSQPGKGTCFFFVLPVNSNGRFKNVFFNV